MTDSYNTALVLFSALGTPVVTLGGIVYFMGKLKATVNGHGEAITDLKKEVVLKEHCKDIMNKQDERFVMLLEEIRGLRTELIGKLGRM